jgi:hypothetical protein
MFQSDVSKGLQDVLVCFEMFLGSLAHLACFTVRAVQGRLSGLSISHSNRCCVALLYFRAGRLTVQNGGFRPGQYKAHRDTSGKAKKTSAFDALKEMANWSDVGEHGLLGVKQMVTDSKDVFRGLKRGMQVTHPGYDTAVSPT